MLNITMHVSRAMRMLQEPNLGFLSEQQLQHATFRVTKALYSIHALR